MSAIDEDKRMVSHCLKAIERLTDLTPHISERYPESFDDDIVGSLEELQTRLQTLYNHVLEKLYESSEEQKLTEFVDDEDNDYIE